MSTETSSLKDRLQTVVFLITIIAVPVTGAVWFVKQQEKNDTRMIERDKLMFTNMIERDKLVIERDKLGTDSNRLNLEYVRLAIGVLQPTGKDKPPQTELRGWAVQILQKSSPVPLSDKAAQALIDGQSNLPKYTDYGGLSTSYYSTPYYNDNATFTSEHYPAPRRNDNLKPAKPAPTPLPKTQR